MAGNGESSAWAGHHDGVEREDWWGVCYRFATDLFAFDSIFIRRLLDRRSYTTNLIGATRDLLTEPVSAPEEPASPARRRSNSSRRTTGRGRWWAQPSTSVRR